MATLGYFSEQTHDTSDIYFKVLSDTLPSFTVTGFINGIAEIRFEAYTCVEDALDVAMGCFETCSNFRQELLKVYHCSENAEFNKIRLSHEGVTLFISKSTTNKDELLAEYSKKREENRKAAEKRREEFLASCPRMNEVCW